MARDVEALSTLAGSRARHHRFLFHPSFQPAGDHSLGPRRGVVSRAEVLRRIRTCGQAAAVDTLSRLRNPLLGGAAHGRVVSAALAVFSDRDYAPLDGLGTGVARLPGAGGSVFAGAKALWVAGAGAVGRSFLRLRRILRRAQLLAGSV